MAVTFATVCFGGGASFEQPASSNAPPTIGMTVSPSNGRCAPAPDMNSPGSVRPGNRLPGRARILHESFSCQRKLKGVLPLMPPCPLAMRPCKGLQPDWAHSSFETKKIRMCVIPSRRESGAYMKESAYDSLELLSHRSDKHLP